MDCLIVDALNYSRAVRQEIPLGSVDAGRLLRGMLDSYPELQPDHADIQILGELPLVLANEAGLTQCFSNLLANAVKFVLPGERAKVRIHGETSSDTVRIWIEDNGIGIPEAMMPKLFGMFSRGQTTHEGTGIGLALVRKVLHRMGGQGWGGIRCWAREPFLDRAAGSAGDGDRRFYHFEGTVGPRTGIGGRWEEAIRRANLL